MHRKIEDQARAKAKRIIVEARHKASAAVSNAKSIAGPGAQPACVEEPLPASTPTTPVSNTHDVRHGIRALEWKAAMRKEDEEGAASSSTEPARPSERALAIRAKSGHVIPLTHLLVLGRGDKETGISDKVSSLR